ncbi:MAG: ATP-dependent DNA ligase [Propionicimonas sp.]
MAAGKSQKVRVGELTLQISSLDKVLYPETGTTKADVLRYYLEIAPVLIPQAAWRPVTRKRWVDGVGTADDPGTAFFRKDIEAGAPKWVPTGRITHSSHTNTYPLANNAAVLAWFAQLAALEVHVPQWRFGVNGAPRNPDRLVIDLDPGPGAGLAECAQVARTVRAIFADMELDPVPVTSGSKGIHLYVPLDGRMTTEQASGLARQLALGLEESLPELVVASQKKTLREGKVLVDWSQNNGAKTTICPYSLRGRSRPTVAVPRTWEELDDPELAHLEYEEVLERVAEGIDPIAGQGWAFDQAPGGHDKLTRYREKRDADRTPEPVPAASSRNSTASSDSSPSFVIQEHHARRLHWDFRLERDGVLVSWAVPKGPSLAPEPHRLAVQTEDHPLEYGSFEGVIPRGEYGGGTVTIWDSGSYELEKWREDEIIVVLHGRHTGGLGGVPRRYVLVRTGGEGEKSSWLLIFTKDQPKAPPIPGPSPAIPAHPPAVVPATSLTGRVQAPDGAGSVLVPAELPAPMLATVGRPNDLDDGENWALELKWDGVRAICQVVGDRVRLVSRNGIDVTERYPELAELSDAVLAEAALLDGEIVALDRQGRPSFALLQQRMNVDLRRVPQLRNSVPVTLMLFDVLALTVDGTERRLMRTPYRSRRELLAAAVHETDHVRVPPDIEGGLAAAMAQSRARHLEGVVAKRTESVYLPGRRSGQWLKFKHRIHQAVVVIGWRLDDNDRLKSLLVALPGADGELHYAGRVGSGIAPSALAELERTLRRIERRTPAVSDVPAAEQRDARWVSPRLIGEVSYAKVTPQGRLREPTWRGWRPDLDPEDVTWETPPATRSGS